MPTIVPILAVVTIKHDSAADLYYCYYLDTLLFVAADEHEVNDLLGWIEDGLKRYPARNH